MKYKCEMCGNIYDEALGDPKHKIPAGTVFADLPLYYNCSVCGADMGSFLAAGQKSDAEAGKSDSQR